MYTTTDINLLKIGSVTKAHGINGQINLTVNYDIDNIDFPKFIFVEFNKKLTPYKVTEINIKNQDNILLQLYNISSEQKAKKFLLGNDVYIDKKNISSADILNNNLAYLINYTIVDVNTDFTGKIDDIIEYENNAVFSIKKDKHVILIPVANELISEIDDKTKTIYISIPEGLTELYQ